VEGTGKTGGRRKMITVVVGTAWQDGADVIAWCEIPEFNEEIEE
jgi:hypothetical protein